MNHKLKKRALNQVRGLIIRWNDDKPLESSTDPLAGEITHKNRVLRLLAREILTRHFDWIINRQRFRWRVTITAVFQYENGLDQMETRELEAMAVFSELNDIAMEQIEDAMRHGAKDKYQHTQFEIECLGVQ